MNNRCYSLVLCFCIASIVVADVSETATEILENYKKAISQFDSISMNISMECDVDENSPNKSFCPYKRDFIFRTDGNRVEIVGEKTIFSEDGSVDLIRSMVIKNIIDGKLCANVINSSLKSKSLKGVAISENCDKERQIIFDSYEYGSPLFSRVYGNGQQNIYQLLSSSANLKLLEKTELIDGVTCRVLTADTKYGKVAAWIAPEKNYNALKWTINKTQGAYIDDTKMTSGSVVMVFDSVKTQKTGSVDIPVEGLLTLTYNENDEVHFITTSYKVTNVQLKPDFNSLQAFKIDFPDNTRVFVEGAPVGIKYIWKDGKVQPQDVDMTLEKINK